MHSIVPIYALRTCRGVKGAKEQVRFKCSGGLTIESIDPRVSRSQNRHICLTSMTWLNDESATAVPIMVGGWLIRTVSDQIVRPRYTLYVVSCM